ncbi:armadillo repeat-containing protein 3 [Xylocopa sonorina]|uniref:armadillo repeat-containing protein 3 n=1 Tax=Xylocopa sonorina TaxID=1818115 RepID=UPI00403A9484
MGPKRPKCVSDGQDRERLDREQHTKDQFDPLHLEVKYPGTAILLLNCQEKPILLAAAAALAKFASKSSRNQETLFDLHIVDNVIPLVTHEDLFTRRFAAKLLTEMVTIPNVRNFLLDSHYYIPHFAKILRNEKDSFMQEFSSSILAQVSNDISGAAQLLKECPDMNFLFERLQSPDPDVKNNTIQIVYNLLQDLSGAKEIIKAKNFNLGLVYELFSSDYPEIQRLALNVVTDLMHRSKDDRLQDHFRRTNGLQALLKLLDNTEWEDIHPDVLKILCLACDNDITVELLDDIGGIKQILKYIEDASNSKLFKQALDVAVRLSHTNRGRKALYTYGMVNYLLHTLKTNVQADVCEIGCHGIGMMTLYNEAAKYLTASNCVRNVFDVLKNENFKWSTRQAALFALNQLLKCDEKNCQSLLDIRFQNYLLGLMKHTAGKVPVETLVGAVECLDTIARNHALKHAIINIDVIDALCASFELSCVSMNDLKIACCKVLSALCVEKSGRLEFLKAKGPSRLHNLLCDVKSIPIRNAAAQLIQLLCADPVLADAFPAIKLTNNDDYSMLKNRSTSGVVPSWDTCIEALFNSHLPIKFAFTGRLSLHDITRDGFYVLRRNVCSFPILDDIFRFKFCPLEPIYVVNCIRPRPSSIQKNHSFYKLNSEGLRFGICLLGSKQSSTASIDATGVFLSTEILNLTKDSKYDRLQCDPCLYDCIELFKSKLIAAESKSVVTKTTKELLNINNVASRAKMLATFVVHQMSGPDPLVRCMDHQLEIHLKKIKASIETSVIPLGMLRVGSYFERALLFKVIADRVHLPAALVRGQYGKAWIEIAVPEDLVLEHHPRSVFPTKLLKPNFIVDLMDSPGDLIPIGSRRATLYCEKRLVCDTLCDLNI